MPLKKKTFSDMTRDSLRYLSDNTEVTYFQQGSVARALVEATNLEISRLQDYISTSVENAFLSTANGAYLDLFGELLGIPRITDRRADASIEDGSVRFYVSTGTLAARLPSSIPGQGIIPAGTIVRNPQGTIVFEVSTTTSFPSNIRSAFVPVRAAFSGAEFNIGANQLTDHNLPSDEVKVTNDISITNGSDVENDQEYRYRLSKAFTTKFGANKTTIQIAATSQPGVARSEIVPYARGAGTFDVLLIPQGNRLTQTTIDNTKRIVESVAAFGISPRIREPEYVAFKVMAQLRFDPNTPEGVKSAARLSAESAILRYFSEISIGGEMIVNQLRAAVLNSSSVIKDVKIIEFCLDGKPRLLSNVTLNKDELFIPDPTAEDAVSVM
jgi:uncharacterized phage protein gp47/JayE